MSAQFITAITINLGPVFYMVQTIGAILLRLAPALIVASYAVSAAMWIFAGPSEKMVKMARSQFIATTVSLAIIAGYFLFRTVVQELAIGGFGQGG